MFYDGNEVSVSLPISYEKSLIYKAAPLIDRVSSLVETGHFIYCIAR